PEPLREDDVREALGGDPREALQALLASPAAARDAWGDERPLVLRRLHEELGVILPEGDPPAEALADDVAVQLALAEAWDAFGRPADFPFLARLPAREEPRQRMARFLRDDVLR